MGGATSAISKEWKRAVLGVPGQNYGGLLLNRSVDWDEFAGQYRPAYPDYTDQIRSDVADFKNTGGRSAGACTAAALRCGRATSSAGRTTMCACVPSVRRIVLA